MNTKKLTIGIDLGDRQHRVCVLNAAGTIVVEEALTNSREVLTAFSARYPGATIIMETGTHSPWVSRLFEARSHTVHVANARRDRTGSGRYMLLLLDGKTGQLRAQVDGLPGIF